MVRTATSVELRCVLGLALLVGSMSRQAGAQNVIALSDSLRAVTDELVVRPPRWRTGIKNSTFGEFSVLNAKEGWVKSSAGRTRGPLLDRVTTVRTDKPFQFVIKGSDSAAVHVRGAVSMRTEVERPLAFGSARDDPDPIRQATCTATAHLVYEEDSAAAWDLRIVAHTVPLVPAAYAFEGTVTSGARSIRLVQVTSRGRVHGEPEFGLGDGYIFEEDGRPVAAAQYAGYWRGGYFYPPKVWIPKSGTARERLEWAAILTAVIAAKCWRVGDTVDPD